MAQILGLHHPHGRSRRSFMLLASDRPSSSHHGQLGSEPKGGRSISPSNSLKKQNKKSSCRRGWNCGIAWKATAYDAGFSYGCQLESQLLHFWFNSLLIAKEKQQKIVQVFWFLPPIWETRMKLLASAGPALAVVAIWRVYQWIEELCLYFTFCIKKKNCGEIPTVWHNRSINHFVTSGSHIKIQVPIILLPFQFSTKGLWG